MRKRTKFNDCDVLYTLNVFLRSSNIGIFVAKINSYHTFFSLRAESARETHAIRTEKKTNIGSEAELQEYEEGEQVGRELLLL